MGRKGKSTAEKRRIARKRKVEEKARQVSLEEKFEIDLGEGTSGESSGAPELIIEGEASGAPDLTIQGEASGASDLIKEIKEEPFDSEAEELFEFVRAISIFNDKGSAAASSSTREVDSPDSSQVVPSFVDEEKEKSKEAAANSLPVTYEEMVCLYDPTDRASSSRPKAGVSKTKAGVSKTKAGVSKAKAGASRQRADVFKPRAEVTFESPAPSVRPKLRNKKAEAKNDENDQSFPVVGQCVIRMDDGEERILKKVDIEPLVICGVIGCGPMAQAIICYLIKTGHTVYAFNRSAEKLRDLPLKPFIVASPAELVEKSEVILCCVSGSLAIRSVMEGADGVLAGLDFFVGKVYVELTSMHPNMMTKYSQEIIAKGGSYLNAQIGRTRPAIFLGCAVVTASGSREAFQKCTSAFAAFCSYAIFLSSNITEASIVSIGQTVIESMAIITLSDSMLAADTLNLPKEALYNIVEKDPRKMAMLPVAALCMIEDRQEVFIPLKHTMKNLRMAVSLKRSDLGGNEFILNGLDICCRVINMYPEAKDNDLSCVYKLRTPKYARPVPRA